MCVEVAYEARFLDSPDKSGSLGMTIGPFHTHSKVDYPTLKMYNIIVFI